MRSFLPALPAAVLALALTGCGSEASSGDPGIARGGDEPTTARALAHVATEYAGEPSSADKERDAAEEFTSAGVGTELRYGSTGEYDGDMLVVAVGKGLDPALFDCDSEQNASLAGCVQTGRGTLSWEAEAPEEDPGVVYVLVDKGDGVAALLFYAGPSITGDPRELDMPIPADVLLDIDNDPRVDLTTSQAAIDAGKDLTFWSGEGS